MVHPILRRLFNRRNALVLVGVLILAGAFWYVSDIQVVIDWLTEIFGVAVAYDNTFAAVVFTGLAALSAMLSFFTSTPLVPIAAALWGNTFTVTLLIVGWFIGGCIAYWIGYGFSQLIERMSIFRTVKHYQEQLGSSNEFLLAFLFRFAVPAEIGAYTLGILRYPFWRYAIITFIAEAPFSIITIYGTNALVERHPALFIVIIFAGLLVVSTFVYLFHRRLKKVRGIIVPRELE